MTGGIFAKLNACTFWRLNDVTAKGKELLRLCSLVDSFFRALRNTHERISLFRPHSASLQCLKCSTIFSNSARGFGAFPYETHPILCFDVCVCTPVSLGNLARAKCKFYKLYTNSH